MRNCTVKRKAFYREYYQITDRAYAGRRGWTADDREQTWRKGQLQISKGERKLFIALQYLILVGAALFLLLKKPGLGLVGCLTSVLLSLLTDFSVLKVELLYRLFSREGPYSQLLHLAFLGKADSFLDRICSSKVAGFARTNSSRLAPKYRVVFRKNSAEAFLVLKSSGVYLMLKTDRVAIDDPTLSLPRLADEITKTITERM